MAFPSLPVGEGDSGPIGTPSRAAWERRWALGSLRSRSVIFSPAVARFSPTCKPLNEVLLPADLEGSRGAPGKSRRTGPFAMCGEQCREMTRVCSRAESREAWGTSRDARPSPGCVRAGCCYSPSGFQHGTEFVEIGRGPGCAE